MSDNTKKLREPRGPENREENTLSNHRATAPDIMLALDNLASALAPQAKVEAFRLNYRVMIGDLLLKIEGKK